jgi:hypothetical protein
MYVAPLVPNTTAAAEFLKDVKAVTERDFPVVFEDDVDPAAARLHDAIMLWAKAYSRVAENNGEPSFVQSELASGRLTVYACKIALSHCSK